MVWKQHEKEGGHFSISNPRQVRCGRENHHHLRDSRERNVLGARDSTDFSETKREGNT